MMQIPFQQATGNDIPETSLGFDLELKTFD